MYKFDIYHLFAALLVLALVILAIVGAVVSAVPQSNSEEKAIEPILAKAWMQDNCTLVENSLEYRDVAKNTQLIPNYGEVYFYECKKIVYLYGMRFTQISVVEWEKKRNLTRMMDAWLCLNNC